MTKPTPPAVGSIEVGPPAPKGESRPRRNYLTPNALVTTPDPSLHSLSDILTRSAREFGHKKAVGWRDLKRIVKEKKIVKKVVGGKEVEEEKEWSFFELGEYQWWTYSEMAENVKHAASALIQTGHSKDTIFNIYAATSKEWQLMANACASQSITFATAYDSLGEDGLRHSINEPSGYGIFTNASLLPVLLSVVSSTPSLKVVIYDGDSSTIKPNTLETIKAANGGIQVYTLKEFLYLGKSKEVEVNGGKEEDLACIMYTSGSTGDPKGVKISNGNILSTIAGLEIMLGDVLANPDDHGFLAYLPLAVRLSFRILLSSFPAHSPHLRSLTLPPPFQHIFEFTVELSMLYLGIPMGYGTIKTLTDTSVRNCVGDIRSFRPTILIGVPAVWELIRKGIVSKVKAGGKVKERLFYAALGLKKWSGKGGWGSWVADKVVFGKVGEATGGRLRYGVNGGAPLSRDTQEFLSTALTTIIQGYGMTESTALTCILPPDYMAFGPIGLPVPSCEIKLVDFEEAGYFSESSPPQGEVWIRGNSITTGYYNNPELTAEAITKDGWLQTGDIGQWNPNGTLSIIDRKKNLVKLAGGEYVALERLESVYKSCQFVANICLHADSNANKAMAVRAPLPSPQSSLLTSTMNAQIIFPHESNVRHMVKEKSIPVGDHADLNELCHNEAINKAIMAELNMVAKKAGLKPLETLQSIVLTPEEWTTANGLLTAAQKLQRKTILSRYGAEIKVSLRFCWNVGSTREAEELESSSQAVYP
ncbi:long-chain acyl-CoA synthetase, partial [Phenoliferia sp. Uapishka_3]